MNNNIIFSIFRADIEFRGAAFPIGGDATIDGLVTVPNILREFVPSNHLFGVSHGMGLRDQLPENQLNVAMAEAGSKFMPAQATELVRRIKQLKDVDTRNTWTLVIITIGTEEVFINLQGRLRGVRPKNDRDRDKECPFLARNFITLEGHILARSKKGKNGTESLLERAHSLSNEPGRMSPDFSLLEMFSTF